MANKPKIIVVDDNTLWLGILLRTIRKNTNIAADIEGFKSFIDAEDRLWDRPHDIDLLVTDIFPSDGSRKRTGEVFAKYMNDVWKIPVIIVTGDPEYAKIAWKELKVIGVFEKGSFDRLAFVTAVRFALESRWKTNPGNDDTDTKKNPPDDGIVG